MKFSEMNVIQVFTIHTYLTSVILIALVWRQCSCTQNLEAGNSNSYRKQDDYGNFEFGYEITDPHGAQQYRYEKGDADSNRVGSYGIQDVDGRIRVVDYVADKKGGFRVKLRSNEPGVAAQDTAYAVFNGADGTRGQLYTNYVEGSYEDGSAIIGQKNSGSGKIW